MLIDVNTMAIKKLELGMVKALFLVVVVKVLQIIHSIEVI